MGTIVGIFRHPVLHGQRNEFWFEGGIQLNQLQLRALVREALNEDIGAGDWSTECLVAETERTTGIFRQREMGWWRDCRWRRRYFANWTRTSG